MPRSILSAAVAAALLSLNAGAYAHPHHDDPNAPLMMDGDKKKSDKDHKHEHADKDTDGKKEVTIAEKDVPAKVMDAVKKAYPGATIGKVEKETYKDGTVHYEFEIKTAAGKMVEVEYNADGELLEEG